jgi:hypothetical protein
MTRVIRNRAGFYFRQDGEWTDHFPDAEKFSSVAAAVAAHKRLGHDVDLVLVIHDQPSPQWDVVLALLGPQTKSVETDDPDGSGRSEGPQIQTVPAQTS